MILENNPKALEEAVKNLKHPSLLALLNKNKLKEDSNKTLLDKQIIKTGDVEEDL
jgi:hypothetical protein